MIIKNVNLEIVCGVTSKLPVNDIPELAFAGKSNVGKSSLINALINRKSYARTSSEPGKTQTINFYRVERKVDREDEKPEFFYVDLPGYGYARVSASEREKWGTMIEKYLNTSKQLTTVFLLVDIRHEPSANDVLMFDWICAQGFRPVVIATKQDKINRSQLAKQLKLIRTKLKMQKEDKLFAFSAQTKAGLEEIWQFIEQQI